jgi:radical SAM superfamily enzyme YgiQ (UPF0313 family)
MYLASYLRAKFKAEVRIIDQLLDNSRNQQLVKKIIDFNPDIVGLSAMIPTAHNLPELTGLIRTALPQSLILLGGGYVSSFAEKALHKTAAHAAVPGEGERAFEEIIRAYFDGGGDLSSIPGIFWRDSHEDIVSNPGGRLYIEDLDSLPFPAYDLIDLPAYWKHQSFSSIIKSRYASLFSSRGCPYNCIYCHRIFGQKFRFHSAGRIIEEIQYLQKLYHINDVEFLDDIFNLNHKRVFEFCDLLKKNGMRLKLSFPNGVRTDILTEQEMLALKEAGLYFCSFSLESGSPRIQELIGKNLDIEKFLKNVELAVSCGIFCNGYSMLGFPTETEAEINRTIDVVCHSRLHTTSFFTVTPFPNTEVYHHVMQTSPEKLSGICYDDMEYATIHCNLSAVPDEMLFSYQRRAHRRFYLNPNRVFRIFRDYPSPWSLPFILPVLLSRLTKGLFTAKTG